MRSTPPSSHPATATGLAGRKAVVTGGAGFIGSHLAARLVALGAEVHVIDDLSFGRGDRVPAGATLHVADIRDGEALGVVVAGADVVFHHAAIASVPLSFDCPVLAHSVNALGTVAVLEAARRSDVRRVVFASSSAVYGEQGSGCLHEELPAAPESLYGLSKHQGEALARLFGRLHGLHTVSLRYFNVYGRGQNPDGPYAAVIARFMAARRAGLPLPVTGDGLQTRDFIGVADVVAANLAAATSDRVCAGEVINIGTGRSTSILDLARMIGGTIEHVAPRPGIRDSAADIGRARDLLGFAPQSCLEHDLARMVNDDASG